MSSEITDNQKRSMFMGKDKPILFSTIMVDAHLNNGKSATRRLYGLEEINNSPDDWVVSDPVLSSGMKAFEFINKIDGRVVLVAPRYLPGDNLWVKEDWRPKAWDCEGYMQFEYRDGKTHSVRNGIFHDDITGQKDVNFYTRLSDYLNAQNCNKNPEGNYVNFNLPWRSARFMPKSAARIWDKCTGVSIQRVQSISQEDAKAEGVLPQPHRPSSEGCVRHIDNSLKRDCYYCSFKFLWTKINKNWHTNPFVLAYSFDNISTTGKPENL